MTVAKVCVSNERGKKFVSGQLSLIKMRPLRQLHKTSSSHRVVEAGRND